MRGSNMNELVQVIAECFPDLIEFLLRGGCTEKVNDLSHLFRNRKGWRLKSLEISPDLNHVDILQLFNQLDLLENISYNYGAMNVTRRAWY